MATVRLLVENASARRVQALGKELGLSVKVVSIIEIPDATYNELEGVKLQAARRGFHFDRLPDRNNNEA